MAKIILRGLSKTFARTVALHSFDLDIAEGSFLCVVGPSGCGKSTLLNLIAGLEQPSQGDILFDGKPVLGLSPKERDVAFVFQSYALYPHKSVFENIAFPLRVAGTAHTEIDQRVNEVARLLEIESLLERKPKEISGGQRQRVALGRAIVRRPKVFLLDEPLSNLDAQLRVQTRAELKKLHEKLNTTFIYVTHDQVEAMSLADQIAVLKDGILQQTGTPEEIYKSPANTFVGSFIGSPGMNFLTGTVSEDGSLIEIGGIRYPMQQKIYKKGHITVGIRPEDIILSDSGKPTSQTGRVYVVEPLGSDMLVYIEFMDSKLIVKVESNPRFKPGDPVSFELNLDRASFFDPQDGRNMH